MPRDDDVRGGEDSLPAPLEGRLVGGERVDLGGPVGAPPQMGHRVDGVIGLDDERDVLLGVAGCQPQLGVRCKVMAVAVVVEPQVIAIARPEVDHFGVREQRDVHRVVRMVMRERDMADRFRCDAERGEGVEDQRAPGHHARIHDD